MTSEELSRLEALATHSRNNRHAFTAIEPFNLLSLIALARVGMAVTPRPIAEAPRDGTPILGWRRSVHHTWYEIYFADDEWRTWGCYSDVWECNCFSHFIPISAIPKPGVE